MQLAGKTILITGGGGFIGSNLCEYFLEKNNVVCLDNFSTGRQSNLDSILNHPSFKLIDGDIRDYRVCKSAVEGIDIVFHQAALGSVPRSIADPITTNSVNIDGFLNVLNASREEGIKRFIYASSSSVYGDVEDLPKREERIGNPLSPYAVTKLVNEHYALVFNKLYAMETIGLRYFNVFGQNQDPDGQYAAAIPRFIKNILERKNPIIFGDGSQTRDFTYIQNVIHANECAAITNNQEAFGTIFNVAYGEQTTVSELVNVLIKEISKFKTNVDRIHAVYEPERKGDVKYSRASVHKANQILGYNPKYSFEKGISEAVEWYVNHL